IPAMIVETVDVSVVSIASATAQVIRNTFQSVGTWVLGVVMSIGTVMVAGLGFISHPGLWGAALIIAGASALSAVLSLAVSSRSNPRAVLEKYAKQRQSLDGRVRQTHSGHEANRFGPTMRPG